MFEAIIGHEKQKEILKNVVCSSNISHAYLFFGKDGIGKKFVAKELAKILLHTDNLETCLDYKYISKEESKKDLSVEQIRKELIDNVYIAPAMSEKKVYIIDDGETMNQSAQNAMLKTLEEPPKDVHIIIISNNISAFLPTIISRISKIEFFGVSKEELRNYILKKYNKELNDNLLEYLGGSIGKAEQIIKNNKIENFNKINELYLLIKNKNVIEALKSSQEVFNDKDMIEYFEFIVAKDEKYNLINYIEHANLRLKNNGNYDIVIDNMILKLIEMS